MAKKITLPRGVRVRGDKFFVDVTVNGHRRTATCDTIAAAVTAQAALRADIIAEGAQDVQQTWTLGHAFSVTKATDWRGSRSFRSHSINAAQVEAHFGAGLRLSAINTTALDAFVAACIAKGNSDGTINRKLASLSKALSVAVERGGLSSKPRFPRRKERTGRIRWLTDTEEAAMQARLRFIGQHLLAEAFAVLADTGLRVSELLAMVPRDVGLSADGKAALSVTVWVNKADLPRTVPLTARAAKIIAGRLAATGDGGALWPVKYTEMRHAWDTARAHLGHADDDQFVIHALRHTFASRLVQRSVPIRVVQQLMGHKTITQTMRYAHLAPQNLAEAVALLDTPAPATARA
ncbi:MAG: site-specific integrase [Parvibaculum sp.]|uniref:tyrosine-type recombinase/integrase n=1 Tax=Parvibaculum sp. TaxID=2024848 RepID=UPI00271A9120|nr:site-specific integrase [Parvibaculum sp.]MDO8839629.1 site-specific integrase [Parvibaculum sp.]